MRCYALGLRRAGANVSVVPLMVPRPEPGRRQNESAKGQWRGIGYEYVSGSAVGASSFLGRRVQEMRGLLRLGHMIRDAQQFEGLDGLILHGPLVRWIVPISYLCHRYGVPVVHDRSEHPFVQSPPRRGLDVMYRRWYMRHIFRMFDGVIVITRALEDTLRPWMRADAWLLRIPILVWAEQFECSNGAEPGVVGYVGNLGHQEEIEDLISAASTLTRELPHIRVRIAGAGTASEERAIEEMARLHGMADQVQMLGAVDVNAIPAMLCSAQVLALPRRAGVFSSAGMPTKLGEYLATGRPVVVTRTGDIPLYLTDGVDAYLADAGDGVAITAALRDALTASDARDIGARGRAVAVREFDPETHMRRFLECIESGRGAIAPPEKQGGGPHGSSRGRRLVPWSSEPGLRLVRAAMDGLMRFSSIARFARQMRQGAKPASVDARRCG